ncbi:MAG: hypothetical protein AAB229_07485 [Candidatus Hydrogenedentota bacterium]
MMRIVSVCLLPGLLLVACVSIPLRTPPAVADIQVRYTGIDEHGVNVEYRFTIHHPAAYPLAPPRLRYDVTVNGDSFASGDKLFAKELMPARDNVLSLPVRISYGDLRHATVRGFVRILLTADILIPHGPETWKLPVSCSGVLPVFRPPEFRVGSMDTFDHQNGWTSARARIDVHNPGGVELELGSLRYWIVFSDTTAGPFRATARPSVSPVASARIPAEAEFRSGNPVLKRFHSRMLSTVHLRVQGTIETEFGSIPIQRD